MRNFHKIEKKSLYSKNHITLCRFGGINKLVKQKGNYKVGDDIGFHRAPERKGFYCFVYPFVERFLLGGCANGGKGYFIGDDDEIKQEMKKFKVVDGYIWTHIKPQKSHWIVAQKDSWYKVHIKNFVKVFAKEFADTCGNAQELYSSPSWSGKKTPMITVKSPYNIYNKDHLEIFIGRDAIIS